MKGYLSAVTTSMGSSEIMPFLPRSTAALSQSFQILPSLETYETKPQSLVDNKSLLSNLRQNLSVRLRRLRQALSAVLGHEYLFWTLVGLLLVLTLSSPERVPQYPTLVDWPTIAALLGLLLVTKGIEVSGALHALAHRVLTHLQSQRALAVFLVGSAALLATVLTNDIALFILVPLTVALQRLADVPISQLVIFEALAVNVGSALSPIGNPQNLFLWQLPPFSCTSSPAWSPWCRVGEPVAPLDGRRLSPHADYGTGAGRAATHKYTVIAALAGPVRAVCGLDRMASVPPRRRGRAPLLSP